MSVTESPNGTASAELPVHLSRFIGRDRELEELAKLVRSARLITLTGAGGSGKTRLAREAAAAAGASFDVIAWVDLTPIANGDLITQEVATALRVHDRPSVSPMHQLVDALGAERVLLILDNCEHVVDACAAFTDALLRACPFVTVLATSREALGVASETAWLVPPLASAEAVQLFHERARLAQPTFALTDASTQTVREICRRLDGIPLAIELAAARIRVLSLEQIASRLDDAFRLLSGGSRTALPRHRTLRATMEWSFGLLTTREQTLLRRLSIFGGSFMLDAVEAVCAGDPLDVEDILDGVSALVDKSLIFMEAGDGVARYRLLETVRQYGAERLDEAGEREEVSLRFVDHYLALIERIAPRIVGGPMVPGLIRELSDEQDNIRAMTAWATADDSRVHYALRAVGSLYWFWYSVGQFREARQLLDRALSLDASSVPDGVRGNAFLSSAINGVAQGEYDRAIAHFEVALPLLRAANDDDGIGTALSKLGAAYLLAGDIDRAIEILDDVIEARRDRAAPDMSMIFARFWRGWAAYQQGDEELARELVTHNLAVGREFALPTTTGHSLSVAAQLELARDNIEGACALVSEALEIEVASGDSWGIAIALDVIAIVAARRGRAEDAARLLGAVDAHRKRIAVSLPGLASREREQLTVGLREALDGRFEELYTEGCHFTTERTVELALAEAARHTAEYRIAPPTPPAPVAGPLARERDDDRPRLKVRALGPLHVYVGDRLIDPGAWGSARPRELLVYLLMHPEGRTKEQVGLAFWPEASSAQLRNSFHVTLHRLRKALGGADWVSLANERYRIDPEFVAEFDVAEFERDLANARRAIKRQEEGASVRLEQALAHFHGDFLDGEPVGDWHLEHRERLQRLYVDGLMELGARWVAEERPAKAAEAYRRVLARDELHEDATVALMRCQSASGERAQAIRVYRRFVDKLREELDAEPGEEAVQLCEQLQQGVSVSPGL